MASLRKLHGREADLIVEQNAHLIEACHEEEMKLLQIKAGERTDWIKARMLYLKHAKAAFKWSTALASQRISQTPDEST